VYPQLLSVTEEACILDLQQPAMWVIVVLAKAVGVK